jgi:hypothetical protein
MQLRTVELPLTVVVEIEVAEWAVEHMLVYRCCYVEDMLGSATYLLREV